MEQLEQRLVGIEVAIASIAREAALRRKLADKSQALDALGRQSLHVVERLDEARRRIRELAARGS